jgi:hypothetical protein
VARDTRAAESVNDRQLCAQGWEAVLAVQPKAVTWCAVWKDCTSEIDRAGGDAGATALGLLDNRLSLRPVSQLAH